MLARGSPTGGMPVTAAGETERLPFKVSPPTMPVYLAVMEGLPFITRAEELFESMTRPHEAVILSFPFIRSEVPEGFRAYMQLVEGAPAQATARAATVTAPAPTTPVKSGGLLWVMIVST